MPTIDIVLCSDRNQMVGAQAMIRSLIQNTEHPETIAFHIVVPPDESRETLALISRSFPRPVFSYEITEFHPNPVLERYVRAAKTLTGIGVPHRAAAINCSRFYLCQLFPKLDKVIYLDADIIVQGDVTELFREASLEDHDLAAVPMKDWGVPIDKQSIHFWGIDLDSPGFNAGVLVTRLTQWREKGLVERIESWMNLWSDVRESSSASLFHFGSQIILILVFRENFQCLPQKWNFCALGYEEGLPESSLKEAAILHWTGLRKPWMPEGLYRELWQKYAGDHN